MADVLARCRRLGFPVLISTDKTIGDMDSKTVLWLFYYLLEIYEPTWSRAPTKFCKSNYVNSYNANYATHSVLSAVHCLSIFISSMYIHQMATMTDPDGQRDAITGTRP